MNNSSINIQKYYDNCYSKEGNEAFTIDTPRYQSFFQHLTLDKNDRTISLDYGCGNGTVCQYFQIQGFKTHGIDISHAAIQKAKESFPECNFEVLDLSKKDLNFPPDHIDILTCLGVLEHIPEPQETLSEFYRILNPNGQAVIVIPNSFHPYFWIGGTDQIYEKPRSLKQWTQLFERNGFEIIAIEKDIGPALKNGQTFLQKLKICFHKLLFHLPLNLTYQFVFTLKKT